MDVGACVVNVFNAWCLKLVYFVSFKILLEGLMIGYGQKLKPFNGVNSVLRISAVVELLRQILK